MPSSYVDFHVCSSLYTFIHNFPTAQRDERVLVVWSDNLETVIPLCRDFEDSLIKLVWKSHTIPGFSPGPSIPATPALTSAVNSASQIELNDKAQERPDSETPPDQKVRPVSGGSWFGWKIGSRAKRAPAPPDVERGDRASFRPVRYFGPFYCGIALALSTCTRPSFICGVISMFMHNHQISLLVVSLPCFENLG